MTQRILADWMTLLRQAPMTAQNYFIDAVRIIDEKFGEGYAAKHPELVAAFMQVCASDFAQASQLFAAEYIENGLGLIAQAIRDSSRTRMKGAQSLIVV
jgi:hypothetical protein